MKTPPAGSISGGASSSPLPKGRVEDANAYREPEKSFRSRNDQWLAEIALDLAAEKMKILRRSRRKGDVHVHVPVRLGGFKVVIRELVTDTQSVMVAPQVLGIQLVACVPAVKRSALAQHRQGHVGEVRQSRFVSATWLWERSRHQIQFDQIERICSSYILSADAINVSMMTCSHRYKLSADVETSQEGGICPNLCTVEEIPELREKR